jgi:hypothetical protein
MSLLVGCIGFLALALVIPLAIRLIRPQNAIVTIIAIAMVIHVLGSLAGAAWLGELDYWQSAAVYWFATVILIYAYGTCYRSLSVQMFLMIARTPSRTMDLRSLHELYFRQVMRDRIDALVNGGRGELHGGLLAITAAGRSDAARLMSARRVFGLSEVRLYYGKAAAGEAVTAPSDLFPDGSQ